MPYAQENEKLETLTTAWRMLTDEFEATKDMDVAVAGFVVTGMIIKQLEKMDKELDSILSIKPEFELEEVTPIVKG